MNIKERFKRFNVEMVTELGGCKPAMRYLREKYGEEIADLSTRKADVIQLLDDGKEDWVINFCLNVMGDKAQEKFFQHVVVMLFNEFPSDHDLRDICTLILEQVKHLNDNLSELSIYSVLCEERIKVLEEVQYKDEAKEHQRLIEYYKRKAVLNILNHMINNPIKSCLKIASYSCEATIIRDISEGSVENIELMRRRKMKEYGLFAMMLTDIWIND